MLKGNNPQLRCKIRTTNRFKGNNPKLRCKIRTHGGGTEVDEHGNLSPVLKNLSGDHHLRRRGGRIVSGIGSVVISSNIITNTAVAVLTKNILTNTAVAV